MNSKIEFLKIQNAKQKLIQRFDFLEIIEIFSAEEGKGKELSDAFRLCGIWNYETQAVAKFPFHEKGIIDWQLYDIQHQKAREFFINLINQQQTDFVWICLSENEFSFWVKVKLSLLKNYLTNWFSIYNDFLFFIENRYALAIHSAEYEWEVLEKQIDISHS